MCPSQILIMVLCRKLLQAKITSSSVVEKGSKRGDGHICDLYQKERQWLDLQSRICFGGEISLCEVSCSLWSLDAMPFPSHTYYRWTEGSQLHGSYFIQIWHLCFSGIIFLSLLKACSILIMLRFCLKNKWFILSIPGLRPSSRVRIPQLWK